MRGKKGEELPYKVFTHIGKKKHDELLSLLNNSRCRTMSELLRKILEDKKIIIQTYDKTMDKVMEELAGIRKEFQSIGININQVTRVLHQTEFNEEQLARAKEILDSFQQTNVRISELFVIMDNLSEQWLPK